MVLELHPLWETYLHISQICNIKCYACAFLGPGNDNQRKTFVLYMIQNHLGINKKTGENVCNCNLKFSLKCRKTSVAVINPQSLYFLISEARVEQN